MQHRTKLALVAVVSLVVVVGWLLHGGSLYWVRNGRPDASSTSGSMRSAPRRDVRRPLAVRTTSDVPATDAATAGVPDAPYERLSSVGTVARCGVGDHLDDGLYEVLPSGAEHVEVRGGVLSMMVEAESGSGRLAQRLMVEGLVSWDGETCTFSPPEWVTVRGQLLHADGQPAAGYDLPGCVFGEFAHTDAQGAWEMRGMAGTSCSPMAFVERDDGAFGKSSTTAVTLTPPGPITGVELVLPPDDKLWPPDMQRELSGQLVGIYATRLEASERRLDRLATALEGCAPDADPTCAVLDAWRQEEQIWVDWVGGELDRLSDPEEQLDAFRDAWLNLY